MEPLALAVTAAGFLAEQITGGALQEAGAKLYNQLYQLVKNKLNIEPEHVIRNRPFLEKRIEDEAQADLNFKNDLESVIKKIEQFKINNANVYQSTEQGVNQQISSNQGTVIGQQTTVGRQTNNNFRKL